MDSLRMSKLSGSCDTNFKNQALGHQLIVSPNALSTFSRLALFRAMSALSFPERMPISETPIIRPYGQAPTGRRLSLLASSSTGKDSNSCELALSETPSLLITQNGFTQSCASRIEVVFSWAAGGMRGSSANLPESAEAASGGIM